MNASGALDLAISLSFVYLLVSLACTALGELIASILRLRQRTLGAALKTLLGSAELKKALYAHPLIKSISQGSTGPSYLPRELFAAATLDLLSKNPTPQVQQGLLALARGTGAEAAIQSGFDKLGAETAAVKTALGAWFDASMQRASGAYKRKAQLMVFLVAAVLVSSLNADTVAIARALWMRPELRTAIADAAGHAVAQGMPVPGTTDADFKKALEETNARLTTATDQLSGLGLPLGWTETALRPGETWPTKLLGLLLTILACSLGAPFWFDLLGKMINIRGAGARPVKPEPAAAAAG